MELFAIVLVVDATKPQGYASVNVSAHEMGFGYHANAPALAEHRPVPHLTLSISTTDYGDDPHTTQFHYDGLEHSRYTSNLQEIKDKVAFQDRYDAIKAKLREQGFANPAVALNAYAGAFEKPVTGFLIKRLDEDDKKLWYQPATIGEVCDFYDRLANDSLYKVALAKMDKKYEAWNKTKAAEISAIRLEAATEVDAVKATFASEITKVE